MTMKIKPGRRLLLMERSIRLKMLMIGFKHRVNHLINVVLFQVKLNPPQLRHSPISQEWKLTKFWNKLNKIIKNKRKKRSNTLLMSMKRKILPKFTTSSTRKRNFEKPIKKVPIGCSKLLDLRTKSALL